MSAAQLSQAVEDERAEAGSPVPPERSRGPVPSAARGPSGLGHLVAGAWPGAAVALVALTFWPQAGSSFELPKLLVLGVFAVAALVSGFRARAKELPVVPASLLVAALASTLAGEIAGPLAVARELSVGAIVLGLSLRRVRADQLVAPLAAAGSIVALVTLAQSLGLDLFGAHAPGRLALFGTLGNPDFVAAFLAPVLALLVPSLAEPRPRRAALPAFVLIALALVATRSLATLLSLGAAAAVFVASAVVHARIGLAPRWSGQRKQSVAPEDTATVFMAMNTRLERAAVQLERSPEASPGQDSRPFSPSEVEGPLEPRSCAVGPSTPLGTNGVEEDVTSREARGRWPAGAAMRDVTLDSAQAATVAGERRAPDGASAPLVPEDRWSRARWLALAAPLLFVLAGCLTLAWSRDWQRALDGRSYLVRVALAPLLAHPLSGHGPGAVEALWPEWEAAAWKGGGFERSEARFVDAQNHLHQDFLERAVEQGVVGLFALLATAGLALSRLWRARTPAALAAAAALVALLSRALVDFPLSRPAEAALFALLVAAGLSSSHPSQEPT